MDLASVVAALAFVGVRVSGSAPNSSVQVDSSRACPPGLAGPEPSGTIHDQGQHFHLIQGGTPSPLEGSLVLPHAHKRRPSKNKEPSVSMKLVMTATLRRGAVS